MMMNTILDDLVDLNREMNRIFGSDVMEQSLSRHWPPVNIYENPDAYVIAVKAPGVSKEDIQISVKDNSLKISGKRKNSSPDQVNYHLQERRYGDFERNFLLNDKIDMDHIEAKMNNGILLIRLSKSPESKPKNIQIL